MTLWHYVRPHCCEACNSTIKPEGHRGMDRHFRTRSPMILKHYCAVSAVYDPYQIQNILTHVQKCEGLSHRFPVYQEDGNPQVVAGQEVIVSGNPVPGTLGCFGGGRRVCMAFRRRCLNGLFVGGLRRGFPGLALPTPCCLRWFGMNLWLATSV